MRRLWSKAIVLSIFLLVGCVSDSTNIDKFNTSREGCYSEYVNQKPKIIYQAMSSCINKEKYDDAVLLFSIAGTYSWYDAARVGGNYAAVQHKMLLSETLQSVDPQKNEIFWTKVKTSLDINSDGQKYICSKMLMLSPPEYQANYMSDKSNYVQNEVNSSELWSMAIDSYLHCG